MSLQNVMFVHLGFLVKKTTNQLNLSKQKTTNQLNLPEQKQQIS
jgi:hypothetical protein